MPTSCILSILSANLQRLNLGAEFSFFSEVRPNLKRAPLLESARPAALTTGLASKGAKAMALHLAFAFLYAGLAVAHFLSWWGHL
jgi:hypothetical protein